MRYLATELKMDGGIMKLFRRSDRVAVYKFFVDGIHAGWSYFKIKTRKEETIKGVTYPKREVFASPSDYGVTAWSPILKTSEAEMIHKMERYTKELEVEEEL